MSDEEIKILGVVDPPYVTACFKEFPHKCRNPGIDIMLLYYQLIAFGYRVKFLEAYNMTQGHRLLSEGFADISGFSDGQNLENPVKRNLSVTMPVSQDQVILFQKDNKEFSPPNLLFDFCPYSVWLFVLATFCCVLLFKTVYKFVLKKCCPNKAGKNLFSSEFPLIGWSLCFSAFLSIYSQYLGITLSRQITPDQQFKNIVAVVKALTNGNCKLVLNQRNFEDLPTYFPRNETVQEAIKNVKLQLINDNDEELIKAVKQPGCNFGINLQTYFKQLNARFGGLKSLSLRGMPKITYYYFYKKDHPLRQKFSVINAGSADSRYDKYFEVATNEMYLMHKINHAVEYSPTNKALSLSQLACGFWLFLGGCFASVIVGLVSKLLLKIGIEKRFSRL